MYADKPEGNLQKRDEAKGINLEGGLLPASAQYSSNEGGKGFDKNKEEQVFNKGDEGMEYIQKDFQKDLRT